eukprot:5231646-Amphidinium_carterae.1
MLARSHASARAARSWSRVLRRPRSLCPSPNRKSNICSKFMLAGIEGREDFRSQGFTVSLIHSRLMTLCQDVGSRLEQRSRMWCQHCFFLQHHQWFYHIIHCALHELMEGDKEGASRSCKAPTMILLKVSVKRKGSKSKVKGSKVPEVMNMQCDL